MIGRAKLVGLTAAAVLTATFAGVCQAGPGTLQFTDLDKWGQSVWFNVNQNGGPFETIPVGFGSVGGLGEHGAAAGSYLTFCLELNEPVGVGPVYDGVLNTGAIQGGIGGSPDPLDARTAFLYTAFLKGTLDDKLDAFNGGNFNYETSRAGAALQQAIWVIEEEIGSIGILGLASQLLDLADDATDGGGEWDGMGIGNIRVVNMSENGLKKQDQLIMIPLPMPVLLGVIGLGGVLLMTRRRLLV